jgi:hypothetical protein
VDTKKWLLRSNFTNQSPPWEANICSTTQGFTNLLWNTEVHYRVHRTSPLVPTEPDESSPHLSFHSFKINFTIKGRGSAVGIGYGLDDRGIGVRVPVGPRIFTPPYRPDRLWGPPSLLYNGYRALFPGVKRQEREADHSPRLVPRSRKRGSIHPLPHVFMVECLVKHRDNFAFYFTF